MAEPNVLFQVLPNGLTVILQEAHLAPVISLQVWAQVGSADERPGEEGLAHFHEHMLFKGTAKRGVGQVAGDVEAAGGQINAYTTFDTTVYYATLPSAQLATGLDVLVDAVRNSAFDEHEIAREREVVLEEIRRAEDSPAHVLGDAMFGTIYGVHRYGAPILGPAENVASFDRAQVRRFFERWYAPDNLVVAAAGDFDARSLATQIADAFVNAKPSGVQRDRRAEPPQGDLRTIVLERPFEGFRIDLAWRGARFRDDDAPLLDLLSFILGECESSRLVQRVKDRSQLVDRIDSSSFTPIDPGIFSVNLETDAQRVAHAIEAVVAEVERLRMQPVSTDELDRARANFIASQLFDAESVSGLAGKLASFHVIGGDYRGEAAYMERIRAATPDDLLRVARDHLQLEHLSVGAVLPEGEGGGLDEARIRESVKRGSEKTRRRFSAPKRVAASPPESSLETYRLANGATLHVQPRRDVPVVAVRVAFLGGLLAETAENAGITSFLSSMWTRGTRSRSGADFARAAEAIAAEISGFSGRSSLGFTIESTADAFEAALDLFAEALLEPGLDPEDVERERRETLAAIEKRADRLAQLAYIHFAEALFPSHPYRLPILGYEASVEAIDAEALVAHHERLIRPENCVIGIAGDVDPDAAARAIALRLGEMPSLGFDPPSPPLDEIPNEIRIATLSKSRAQAHLVLGFRGVSVSDPDRVVLDVLSQVLAGQAGRLFLELRDRQSLAYSVSAVNVEGLAPGHFSLYIATAPEKLAEAQHGILAELERLVQEAPSEAELVRAQHYLTGSFAIEGQRNGNHAAHVALDALYGLGPDAHSHYPEQVAAVTREDLLRVAQRILLLDAYTLSTVGGADK